MKCETVFLKFYFVLRSPTDSLDIACNYTNPICPFVKSFRRFGQAERCPMQVRTTTIRYKSEGLGNIENPKFGHALSIVNVVNVMSTFLLLGHVLTVYLKNSVSSVEWRFDTL